MNKKPRKLLLAAVTVVLAFSPWTTLPARAADEEAGTPRIMLDKSPAVVAYQLKRLTNPQLSALDRKPNDPKYKPVYMALLTRKGLEKKLREEAVEALVGLDKSDPITVLLAGLGKVEAEDKSTNRDLASLMLAQKPATLTAKREQLETLAKESENDTVKQAAYAGLVVGDGSLDKAWEVASANDGLKSLLGSVALIPTAAVREKFYAKVSPLTATGDEAVQVAAIDALGYVPNHEADTFKALSAIVQTGTGDRRAAAVRAVGRMPASKWPRDQVEPLALGIVKLVETTPADQRTTPEIVQAVQLGNDLSGALTPDKAAPIRKQLRALAVRVVLMKTLNEQMMYDLRYFTVQAGKPVQIILQNDDNMPHNLVISAPGGLSEIGTLGGAMPVPEDPKEKPYVPNHPKVLEATHLVGPGESITLAFTAPAKPGNYPYLCSYPAHWVKMYGIMQVVEDLDAYDANPTPPKDPLTRKVYDGQKNESMEGAHEHKH